MNKLSINSLSFKNFDYEYVFERLKNNGFSGIEIAPNSIWNDFLETSDKDIEKFCEKLNDYNLIISGINGISSILKNLNIMDQNNHEEILYIFEKILYKINILNTNILVFGCPNNRRPLLKHQKKNYQIAKNILYKIGDLIQKKNIFLAFEPLPSIYKCNFINNYKEGLDLINFINHPSIKLNLDTGTIYFNNYNDLKYLDFKFIYNCHISQPFLKPFNKNTINHNLVLNQLSNNNYNQWITLEMKTDQNIDIFKNSINLFSGLYK